jgi:hypothetical protein
MAKRYDECFVERNEWDAFIRPYYDRATAAFDVAKGVYERQPEKGATMHMPIICEKCQKQAREAWASFMSHRDRAKRSWDDSRFEKPWVLSRVSMETHIYWKGIHDRDHQPLNIKEESPVDPVLLAKVIKAEEERHAKRPIVVVDYDQDLDEYTVPPTQPFVEPQVVTRATAAGRRLTRRPRLDNEDLEIKE